MLPPAPGLFSTTTDWPHASVSFCAIRRPAKSSEPPGGNGTIRRTDFAGYACAHAGETTPKIAQTAVSATAIGRNSAFIVDISRIFELRGILASRPGLAWRYGGP